MGEKIYSGWKREDLYHVFPAFSFLIDLLIKTIPDAKIYCILNTHLSDEVEEFYKLVCEKNNIDVIELHDIEKCCWHPTVKGMKAIKEQILEFIQRGKNKMDISEEKVRPIKYEYTGNSKIPAIITKGENFTPVWIQQEWESGEFAQYICKNGCGHCCTAMVLNLCGVKINPHEEYELCRKLWGEPRMGEPLFEDHFLSETGIAEVIRSFGIKAEAFGVETSQAYSASEHIIKELASDKMVIIWSHPSDKLPDNPFSAGEHYILAVGITENGKILVANSSLKGHTKDGIQFTDRETLEKVLFENTITSDYTWGRYDFSKSGAYVVIG